MSKYYNSVELSSEQRRIVLTNGKRKAKIGTAIVYLNFEPRFDRTSAFISQMDFVSLIDPILRDTGLPKHPLRRIIIDPGHGGKDNGAVGSRVLEKNVNLRISKDLKNILEPYGYVVALTRTTDEYISLRGRGVATQKWGGDLFVSIHCNATHNKNVSGIETFIVTPRGASSTTQSKVQRKSVRGNEFDRLNSRLGYEIHQQMLSTTGARDRGLKYHRWQVLREASCPAVLIESGFLSNAAEERKLESQVYQHALAVSIAKGIISFHNALKK